MGRGKLARLGLDVGLLVLAWLALYVPNHGVPELVHEEGRRAIPSEEMLQSGDYVLPTIWGHPYLAKPPVHFWTIAATSASLGEVTPSTARLPSLLATLATALLVYGLGTRQFSRLSGLFGAAVYLLTPMVFEKGALAEIEAVFSFVLFSAVLLAWRGVHGSRAAVVAAGLVLGLAFLTKGPVAWIFFLAGPLAMAFVEPTRRSAWLRVSLIALGLSAIVGGAWIALIFQRMTWEELEAEWYFQMAGAGFHGWAIYFEMRVQFVYRTLLGFLPGVLAAGIALGSRERGFWLRSEILRLGVGAAAVSIAFFFFYPRAQPRYVFPLVPWVALFGGHVLACAMEGEERGGSRLALRATAALAVLLAVGLAVVSAGHRWWGDDLRFGLDAVGAGFALTGLALGFVLIGALRRHATARAAVLTLVLLALARGYHVTQIVPARGVEEGRTLMAAQIEAALPIDRVVRSTHWGSFNTLSYVDRDIRYVRDFDLGSFSAGDVLLADEHFVEGEALRDAPGWQVLLETPPVDRGARLLVLRYMD